MSRASGVEYGFGAEQMFNCLIIMSGYGQDVVLASADVSKVISRTLKP